MCSRDFESDHSELIPVVNELWANENQVNFALSRALNRGDTHLRVGLSKIRKDKLELHWVSAWGKRLKTLK